MKRTTSVKLVSLLSTIVAVSCAGPQGEPGPQGTPGADGSTGIDGVDGVDGQAPQLSISSEPAGVNCPNGGLKVSTGIDVDGDHVVDEEEATQVEYVCSESEAVDCSLFQRGNSVVVIEDDADKLPIRDCESINNLVVRGPDIVSLEGLESLRDVSKLSIVDAASLANLQGLAGLSSIRNGLSLTGAPSFFSFSGLDSLQDLGSLTVIDSDIASFAGFPRDVIRLRGALQLFSVRNLANLQGLEEIVSIGDSFFPQNGVLSVSQNPQLVTLAGLGVTEITGSLFIDRNPVLSSVGLDSLVTIGSSVFVANNPLLPSCEVDELVSSVRDLSGQPVSGANVVNQLNDTVAECQ